MVNTGLIPTSETGRPIAIPSVQLIISFDYNELFNEMITHIRNNISDSKHKVYIFSRDALLVNCKISSGETCIIPKPEKIRIDELYKQGAGHVWLSEMDQGSLVKYYLFLLAITRNYS